jgi:hypothetical protein
MASTFRVTATQCLAFARTFFPELLQQVGEVKSRGQLES